MFQRLRVLLTVILFAVNLLPTLPVAAVADTPPPPTVDAADALDITSGLFEGPTTDLGVLDPATLGQNEPTDPDVTLPETENTQTLEGQTPEPDGQVTELPAEDVAAAPESAEVAGAPAPDTVIDLAADVVELATDLEEPAEGQVLPETFDIQAEPLDANLVLPMDTIEMDTIKEGASPDGVPNLRPYQPSGWDGAIVASTGTGTTTSTTLYAGQPFYIDWAVLNNGSATASGRFYSCLYVDGTEVARWYTDNLPAGYYAYVKDYKYTINSPGAHTLRIRNDCTGAIAESNEGDNVSDRTFIWVAPSSPNLAPYQPSGWDGAVVAAAGTGTTRSSALYTDSPTYIDWAIVNKGTATASGRFYACLYLDNSEIGRWYVDNLARNYYVTVKDFSYLVATAGTHTLKLVADCTGAMNETNESDNVYERRFTWTDRANLRPYQPSGWDAPIVPAGSKGGTIVTPLVAGRPAYIDWAIVNNGRATAKGRFYSCLYLDNREIQRWYTTDLAVGNYAYVTDWSYTVSTPGNHTLKIYSDCTTVINESNESDNVWERTFTWLAPNLLPYQPGGWEYKIVPSPVKGGTTTKPLYSGTTASGIMLSGRKTFIDWSVANVGTADAVGRFYSCLYLDNREIARWYTDGLGVNRYAWVADWSYVVIQPGVHKLKIVVDCTSTILETNESDNTYERSFTWNDGKADTDKDALLDSWEVVGYDENSDGWIDVDLPAMGANSRHQDLFVEVDWMADNTHSHRPTDFAVQRIVRSFANAPRSNPDGVTGITLHVDMGGLGGGNAVGHQTNLDLTSGWGNFDTIKNANFNANRRRIFRYSLFAHQYNNGCSSGIARGIPASDFIVTLGCVGVGSEDQQSGTFMHEMGHTLGLKHGGVDHVHYKPNFLSIMNYRFQFSGLRYDRAWGLYDYSRFSLPSLNENSLNENIGLNGGSAISRYGTAWSCPDHTLRTTDSANGAINWDCDNSNQETGVRADINYGSGEESGARTVLNSGNDWAMLSFKGGTIGAGSLAELRSLKAEMEEATPEMEITVQELELANPARATSDTDRQMP